MQGVISSVADVIGAELTRAKQRIAKGRDELQAEVRKLPADLQALGKQAAGEFAGKFDELTQSVNDKGTELVDTLASKYTEALKAVDEQIAAEKEKNKGLIAKVVDAVKGIIDTILTLKDLLLGVLAKAAQAVGAIIKDPIGFLGRLVSGVGAGLRAFMANIANHLKKGLVSWLLGAAAKAGLQLPERFDLKGILALIASMLGLTWAFIRSRVVAKGVPEQAMSAVESTVPEAQKIQSEGIGGVWEQLKDKVGDLKETLLSKIAEYLIPTVIIAGITWIISLLNPASAFIKACKAIIDIVTFIVDRGAQIIAFVNAVLDAILAIARGGAGGVSGLIETALASAIPVLIGFLAALLGISGLTDKVRKLFQSLSKPVRKAVDWITDKIAALGKKIWAKLKPKAKGKDDKKDTDKNQIKPPRRLVAPTELAINASDPLAQEIEQARSGQSIYQKGGDPAQVTKAVLAQHKDARYDQRSGTLILPKTSWSGQPGSLASLGSELAAQTGVSQVTLEKKGNNQVEVWVSINPKVKSAKIKTKPPADQVLKEAVANPPKGMGIVKFLKAMAAGQTVTVKSGTINMAGFEAALQKQVNLDHMKQRFRSAMPGRHEWIPSNYILQVTIKARDLIEGPAWIDLQHELRSETFRVVFGPAGTRPVPDEATPKIVEEKVAGSNSTKKYSVLSGHVGAVYFRGKKQTKGENEFHDKLRNAFKGKSTVNLAAKAALEVVGGWVWDGTAMNHDIHPECKDVKGKQVTSAGQKVHLDTIEGHFQPFV
jgi:hypothetical protein